MERGNPIGGDGSNQRGNIDSERPKHFPSRPGRWRGPSYICVEERQDTWDADEYRESVFWRLWLISFKIQMGKLSGVKFERRKDLYASRCTHQCRSGSDDHWIDRDLSEMAKVFHWEMQKYEERDRPRGECR